MATHRAGRSTDLHGLQPPPDSQQQTRRQSLSSGRPPSPLRHGFIPDTGTGIHPDFHSQDDDDDDSDDENARHDAWLRSPSPASSVSQLAANFAQRVVSAVSAPKSPSARSMTMPTDAELEASAAFERDRSRREAERILQQEAMDRRLLEERVLEMMESTKSLPPPPSRSQTMGAPSSPSGSQKDKESWWSAAKNRLASSKDKDLTPAQQVVLDAKAKEKERKKSKEGKDVFKRDSWASQPEAKFTDPAFSSLNSSPTAGIPRRPITGSPLQASPTPITRSNLPPDLTTPPRRADDRMSMSAAGSPSQKDPVPVYATFDHHGTLDIPATLLTIAKRFEKLEKWTVGHVRALEERMGDVERWLVEKENEKEQESQKGQGLGLDIRGADAGRENAEMREELSELQSRLTELGREVARLATSPAHLSSGPSRTSPPLVSSHGQMKSEVVEHLTGGSIHSLYDRTPRRVPSTARESTSPPLASKLASSSGSISRLPYPSGDYATPPDSSFSPKSARRDRDRTSSPTEDIMANRSLSQAFTLPPIQGLPTSTSSASLGSAYSAASYSTASSISPAVGSTSGLPYRAASPQRFSPTTNSVLSASRPLPSPKLSQPSYSRTASASPTPQTSKARKRYTVALGGPVVAPDEDAIGNQDDDFGDETIGKKASRSLAMASLQGQAAVTPPRARAQSTYGYSSPSTPIVTPSSSPAGTRPLNIRSRSTERLFTPSVSTTETALGNKFVDPLVLRRQQDVRKGTNSITSVKPGGVKAIGDLVKFFDGDGKKK